ncbi:MAG: NADP-dependent oxidoreductase [Chthoniobacter sp.]|nr:NADP-dependent oxidoreductase [Chthoniobacter sp.]
MKTMKAFCLNDSATDPSLAERELPVPEPTATDVLIRVHAAGVTPTEMGWYPTTHTKDGGGRQHAVPGHEFSGVIAAVGAQAGGFQVGQEVYGMNDWFADGATAEYCLTQPACIVAKPQRLSHAEAASVPIGALTARQGLYDRAKVRAGERVLIHGGSGAVGVFAIQLAWRAGAQVFTTASARHADFLEHLGASHVIDYKTERFEDHVGKVDVVFDAVGGETLRRSWDVLKPAGRMVTIAANEEGTQDERTKAAFFIVEPKQEQLVEIALLLDRGELKPCLDDVIPFAKASAAYFGKLPRPRERGKIVIAVAE